METIEVTSNGVPVADWPIGWDIAEDIRYETGTIEVGGHLAHHYRSPDDHESARMLFLFTPPPGHPWHGQDVLIKICHTNGQPKYAQGLTERAIWDALDHEDRVYFAEILGAGGDPMTWDWCAQVFHPDLSDAHEVTPYTSAVHPGYEDEFRLTQDLAEKYDLTDWSARQWKLTPDGVPLIHDYGISPAFQPGGRVDDEDEPW